MSSSRTRCICVQVAFAWQSIAVVFKLVLFTTLLTLVMTVTTATTMVSCCFSRMLSMFAISCSTEHDFNVLLQIVEGASHFGPMENPRMLARLIAIDFDLVRHQAAIKAKI